MAVNSFFFFICAIKSPGQRNDKYSQNVFDSDFAYPCLDVKFHFRMGAKP